MKRINLLKYIGYVALLSYGTLGLAQSQDQTVWFVDQLTVPPSQQVTVNYSIPTTQHILECAMADSSPTQLATVEWKYKGQSYKGQMNDAYYRVTLNRDDYVSPWKNPARTQLADASGTLVVTNLDNVNEFSFSCSYSLDLGAYSTKLGLK